MPAQYPFEIACTDRGCDTGILAVGWGSGTANFPYLSDPLSAIKAQTSATITSSTSDTDTTGAANAARGKTAALVFITADSGEGYITVEGNAGDRNDLNAWHSGNAVSRSFESRKAFSVLMVWCLQACRCSCSRQQQYYCRRKLRRSKFV